LEGFHYGLGIYSRETPCGTVWGHDGGIAGYAGRAYTDRRGTRSSAVFLPTQPDDAIGAAADRVDAIAPCVMLGRPVPAAALERSAPVSHAVANG